MVLGWLIIISLVIAMVFGWEFMMDMWNDIFNYIREFAEILLDNMKGTTKESLI